MTRSRRRPQPRRLGIIVVGQLIGVALGSSLAAPIASAQTLTPVQGFTVVDADGVEVGPALVIVARLEATVAFEIDSRLVTLAVREEGFQATRDSLYFESSNCSGTPFMQRPPREILPLVVLTLPGRTVYVDDQTAPPRTIMARSYLHDRYCSPILPPQLIDVVPGEPLIDLDPLFTPPFRLVPRL